MLAPTVLERSAPSYEYRAMPARWAADDVEVVDMPGIDVAEQTASFLRIVLPGASQPPGPDTTGPAGPTPVPADEAAPAA